MSGFNNFLKSLTGSKNTPAKTTAFTKDDAAKLLNISPEAFEAFENSYRNEVLEQAPDTDNLFDINAKQASQMRRDSENSDSNTQDAIEAAGKIADSIVNELLEQTEILAYDGSDLKVIKFESEIKPALVNLNAINALPEKIQPQLTGRHMKRDIPDTGLVLLQNYKHWLEAKTPEEKQTWYHMFRQGLDILDLDPLTYQILSMNQNTMGFWLPGLVNAVKNQNFFKIPKTKVMKVPITLLQLTRQEYQDLTPTTMKILDEFCFKAFDLNPDQDYFIKTGTYSSKFDFRNAHVHGTKEVHELGEYLLFIHFQALQMASPLAQPCIYGVSTTNEWVVREYIPDPENRPCIYKGLPLRTEYRIFVDFEEDKILGTNPYWDPNIMRQRFGHEPDAENPHQIHDYIVYQTMAEKLQADYDANIENIKQHIQPMLKNFNLSGQWSIDIMQSGSDFYIIDMALAANSALNFCVPKNQLKPVKENWLPEIKA